MSRVKEVILISFIMSVILLSFTSIITAQPVNQLNISVVVTLRDYLTDEPYINYTIRVRLQIRTNKVNRYMEIAGNVNATGQISAETTILGSRVRYILVRSVSIVANNKTPLVAVKIGDMLVEEVRISSSTFNPIENSSDLVLLSLPLSYEFYYPVNVTVLCDIWALKGKLVNVSDYDPLLGRKVLLDVRPGYLVQGKSYKYETTYLLPLNYQVIVECREIVGPERFIKFRYKITNDTMIVPWTQLLVKSALMSEVQDVKGDITWFMSFGYPLMYEEEVSLLDLLFNQSLVLFQRGNYTEAIGAVEIFHRNVETIKRDIALLKASALNASLVMLLMILGFSIAASHLLFSEPRLRGFMRFFMFMSLSVLLALTQPTYRIASALLVNFLGVKIESFDFLTLIVSIVVISSLTYVLFVFLLFLIKPERRLSPTIALQYLKARKWLTLVVIITITVTIASSALILRISQYSYLNIETIEHDYNINGLYIKLDLTRKVNGFSEYELSWLKSQLPNSTFYYILEFFPIGELQGTCLVAGEDNILMVNIVASNVSLLRDILKLENYVYAGGFLSEGTCCVMMPLTYILYFRVGDEVEPYVYTLKDDEMVPTTPLGPPLKVIGFFDHNLLENVTGPDGKLLFEFPGFIVFTPITSLENPESMAISRVLVVTNATQADLESLARKIALMFPARVAIVSPNESVVYEKVTVIVLKGFESVIMLLIIASLLIFTTLLGVMEERERDLRTLAVLGAPPSTLSYVLLTESLLIGFISSLLGWVAMPLVAFLMKNTTQLLGLGAPEVPLIYAPTMESAFVAVLLGLAISLASAVVPASRIQKLSLMGRRKRRVLEAEDLRIEEGVAKYTLPLRVSMFEGNMLYRFLRSEIVLKRDFLGEEIYLDGTFSIKFGIHTVEGSVINATLRTVRREDVLLLELHVPERFRHYMRLSDTIRNIEEKILKYPEWKARQLRYIILRRAPPRRPFTLDELIEESEKVVLEIKDINLKLSTLERLKTKVPVKLYSEYRSKYDRELREKYRQLKVLATRLEPFYKQLKSEISRLSYEIDKLNLAKELREMSEEEYNRKYSEISKVYNEYKDKLSKVEEVFDLLRERERRVGRIV